MNLFSVEFYETSEGIKPVEDFLSSLNDKMLAKALQEISLLEEYGNLLREPYSKELEDGIFELRIKAGSDISRILYFFRIGRRIILTNGFKKKTQKTPRKEIALAKKYRQDYLNREV